ncbi:MAG: PAS domain S-box protein, partial [bacterium]|nr:PAS domain S-box protein [bacterium]
MSGARAGAVWSVIITTLLITYAHLFPFSDGERKVVWLTAIMAGGGGLAAVIIERGREQANRNAKKSREKAEADAQNRLYAEGALRESQALFATVFQRSSSLMALISLETGRILDVNESFVRTMGWSAAEVLGKRVSEMSVSAASDDQQQIFKRVVVTGSMEAIEVQWRTKSDGLVWLFGSVEVLKHEGLSCVLAEGIDITERKRSDEALARDRHQLEERFAQRGEQLQESLEQLRQQDRLASVGTLAAGVAHQINNPIGGIIAATEFAAMADDDPERERIRTEALATAHDEAIRCGRIVKNVLKFSRNEPTAKWIEDLTPMVLKATQLSRAHVSEQGGRVEMDLASSPLEVQMSPIDIEQVVVNLIHNASESKPGGA